MKLAILRDIQEIKSGTKELREFGITMAVALLLMAGLIYWKSAGLHYLILLLSAGFALLGLVVPSMLKPFQKAWMAIAVVMGWVMSQIILFTLFFAVVTPISIIGRLLGEAFLDLKMDNSKSSYWIDRRNQEFQKSRYEKQF